MKVRICVGKDCRKHKKMQKRLQKQFPDAKLVSCLKICKSPVVVVDRAVVTKVRKKKHVKWLQRSIFEKKWHAKLKKRLWGKKSTHRIFSQRRASTC